MSERIKYCEDDPRQRLHVEVEDGEGPCGGLFSVADERMTSDSIAARVSQAVRIYLTEEEAVWARDALTELLKERGR